MTETGIFIQLMNEIYEAYNRAHFTLIMGYSYSAPNVTQHVYSVTPFAYDIS